MRSVAVMTQQVGEYNLAMADLVIHPPLVHADLGDFSHALELIEGGRKAALEALPIPLHGLVAIERVREEHVSK